MDLFEKFSAVSVSAGSRISDLDRFFCEQHQAAYHAARSALLELRCIWEDVEKKQDELLQETKELLSGRNSYTVSRDLSITDARLKELLMEQPCSFVQNLVHYFNRTYHTALSADAILQRMLPEKPEYRRRDEEAWAAYEEAVLARKLTYTEVDPYGHKAPRCELVYSRSDYDGHRWHTIWFPCWEDRRTQALAQKVDQFMDALLETEEFRSLGQMKRMCRACAEPTSDPTEFNLYGETASFYIWIRAITREKDYNLYVHFYLKDSV